MKPFSHLSPLSTFSRYRRMACVLLAGCLLAAGTAGAEPHHPQVLFVTNKGQFVMELYPDKAPDTVRNFLQYVQDGHYNGTVFHRVIAGFMVQGGGFDKNYRQKSTRAPVLHEGHRALAAGLRNTTGTVAMARTAAPQSATAQFFINVQNNAFLDPTPIPEGDPVAVFSYQGKTYRHIPRAALLQNPALYGYTVFGKIVSGMPVVQGISRVPTGAGGPFASDVPLEAIVIESARKIR